jgi:ATP-binding cassette subfamily B protein
MKMSSQQNLFTWLRQFYKQHPRKMLSVLLLTVVTTGIKVAFPILLKYIVDSMQGDFQLSGTQKFIWWQWDFQSFSVQELIWWYLAAGFVHEFFTRALPLSRAYVNMTFAALIRTTYFQQFTAKATAFFQRFDTGDLMTRLTDDIDGQWDRIEWYSCSGIMRPIEAILILGFTLSVMIYYSWELTLWSFLPLPFLVIMLARLQDKLSSYTNAKQQAASASNTVLENCLSGIRVVKSTNSQKEQLERYTNSLDERIKREKKFFIINELVHLLSNIVNHTGTIIVVIVGGYFTMNGRLELGTFLLFMLYLERLIEPIRTLTWFFASSRQIARYAERLYSTEKYSPFESKDVIQASPALEQFHGISFENVSFRYLEKSPLVLDNFSMSIKQGEMVALVGAIGSGKTTVLELIMKSLQATDGTVKINDIDVQNISMDYLSRLVGYVPQQALLVSDTIENNIILGNTTSIAQQDIIVSLQAAQLSKEIERFPQGMQTHIGQRGVTVSGGQKQRLTLARTLARRPQLLLLDDSTSAMDATTEEHFWQDVRRHFPNITVLVATHREATMKFADRIIYL